MFGTELHLITLLYIVVELLILIVLASACISRPKDESRTRFFILTLLFLTYNLFSGLYPDDNYSIPLLLQNVLAYTSGISLASYYFYYLVKELNIQGKKFFNAKLLFLSLICIFLIGYVPTYLITGDIVLSKQIFIVLPLILTIYFCGRTIIFIFNSTDRKKRHQRHHKILTFSGYFGIIFMASMPIVVFFGDYQTINIGLVNISFLLSATAFLKGQLYQSRMEYNALKNIGYFAQDVVDEELEQDPLSSPLRDIPLTLKEAEVAELIMQNLTYREISERLCIAERTASKHASNIFKKVECSNKKEFVSKFS